MKTLSTQEKLFLDRGAKQILDDDLRIFKALCNNDEMRGDVVTNLSNRTHAAIRQLVSVT